MPGYDLKEGKYRTDIVNDEELWAAFKNLFSSQVTMVSSYKYGFLKAIIDNLYNVDENLVLSFDQLFSKFAEIYWNLILKYQLRQQSKKETYIEQILVDVYKKYTLPIGIPYENLSQDIIIEVSNRVKMKCKRYVVGALYDSTKELFYSFSKKEEWIKINPQMYEFLCGHKVLIEKLNYYEWARFLERVNSDSEVNHLLDKIDDCTKRKNLSYYRDILLTEFENKCFYCGKRVSVGNVEVDHFIPWSFLKDDKLWNFVLACPGCNNRKRDRMAEKTYLNLLVDRNSKLDIEIHRDMNNYNHDRLVRVYDWAVLNGYDRIWKPDRRLEG